MKRIVSLLATLCLFQSSHAATAVPDAISYQGRALTATGALMGAGTPVNRTVIFRIWDHASNSLEGNLIYSEQQVVTIAEGEFSVLVGTGTATAGTPLGYSETTKGLPTVKISDAFGGVTRYLGVTIDDGTAAVDNEISPRQQIVSGAFALRSKVAESVDGLAITTAMLANNAVTTTQVNDAAITTSKLAANAVTSTQIADGSVTTAKLADASVTASKIATDTILAGNIAAGAVGTSEILDGTVATADMGAGAVTTAKIATDTILAGNIAAGAVGTSEILDGTVLTADIGALQVTNAKIATDTILAGNIAAGAVGTSEIADGSVTVTDLNFKPATGDENLRIIRGTVSRLGAVVYGSGFTVYRVGVGMYRISFVNGFSGPPSITASITGRYGITAFVVDPNRGNYPPNGTDALYPTAGGFDVTVLDASAVNAYDFGFQFIAVGPR